MTSKGQLTVPASIPKKFGIGARDQLLLDERERQITLAPATHASLADLQAAAAQQHVYFLKEIRKIVVPIAQRHQLKRLTLFGAYARGKATAQSDLDFRAGISADFGMYWRTADHEDGANLCQLLDACKKNKHLEKAWKTGVEIINFTWESKSL